MAGVEAGTSMSFESSVGNGGGASVGARTTEERPGASVYDGAAEVSSISIIC